MSFAQTLFATIRTWLYQSFVHIFGQRKKPQPTGSGTTWLSPMTTETLSPTTVYRDYDNNGNPLVGGKLFTYAAGTNTKLATYTDSTGATPNPNPVILNSRGEANVWIPPNVAYKYVIAPSTDTDPPANPIRTTDQIVNSQLLTLYGGVDTGIVNAYVINFVSNFTAYTDGIVIVWVPSHTNTSTTPTININNLGIINIVNGDGTAVVVGAISANNPAQILIKGGTAELLNPYAQFSSGTFTVSWTGFSAAPASNVVNFTRIGNLVALGFSVQTGTSSGTSFGFTGLPAALVPSTLSSELVPCVGLIDNSVAIAGGTFAPSGSISSFFKDGTGAAWTGAGAKGFGSNTVVIYTL
jgi:hypothetical protein